MAPCLARRTVWGLFGHAWGAQFMDYGKCGHINAESGLASWPEGHVLLQDLMKD